LNFKLGSKFILVNRNVSGWANFALAIAAASFCVVYEAKDKAESAALAQRPII
jgi:hypothetical protein